MKISFYTLGCKLNQAESDELKEQLINKKYEIVDFGEQENICIIRACAVTSRASQKTRQLIRRAKNKNIYVIATGCLENSLKEIDFIGKNNQEILNHIQKKFPLKNKEEKKEKQIDYVRKFIKIQNGCNFNCTYCIIPSFRGTSESLPTKQIITKIKKLEKKDFKEIILTGVNICQYQDKKINLAKLLKKILKETKILRIRLGSLDPRLINSELITVFEDKRMMNHVHLSLQSGSDKILKKMNRHYSNEKYQEIIKKFRQLDKNFSFSTDIIVGFPGENETDFASSCQIIKDVNFSKTHIFPFSARPKTPANKMTEQVDEKIKNERVKKIIKIAEDSQKKYLQKLRGQEKEILIEGKRNGFFEGYIPEFVRFKIKSKKNIKNEILKIKI
ncbi:MAG: tRNA (N(6)-L-threonylcarbamoyladenosine(37)-C(2))-methylthiotransferase MtaB [Patescibacteria group bacterium]